MTNVEQFANRIFNTDMGQQGKHLQNTSDRTVWYMVNHSSGTMMVPGLNVLRVNSTELDKFLAAVESFIVHDIDDPIFDWEHLTLHDYSGERCEEGLLKLRDDVFQGQLVGTDIETRNLDWDGNKLLSIGFATDDAESYAFYDIPNSMYSLLQDVLYSDNARFAWHNGKFDKEKLWYTCGIESRVDEDSMLKHLCQVSEKKGTQGLKYLGPLYLQAPQWDDELDAIRKKYCKDHKIKLADFTYDMIPTSVLIPYMHRDCIATRRLIPVFDRIKEEGTDDVYRTLIKATEVFSWLEINGAYIDTEHLDELEVEFNSQYNDANSVVKRAVEKFWNPVDYSNETGAKYSPEFTLSSPRKLKWLLSKATGIQVDSSDAATIDKLNELVESNMLVVDDAVKDLFKGIMRSRKASKYRDTYVYGMQKAMREDGRVSGTYNLAGTETGRLSSSNPNMQNIPRNKDVKNIFVATPGYKLVQLDYSQCIKEGTPVGGIPIELHSNAVCKGMSSVGTVKTKRGYEVVCTADHRILTDKGWKEASSLTAEDYIALQPERQITCERNWLRRFEGLFLGDGSFNGNKSGISVAKKDAVYMGDIAQLIENAGFEVGYQSTSSIGVKCGTTGYIKYLRDTYDKKALRIPSDFEHVDKHSELAALLGGLFDADGTVAGNTISVATAQLQFAKDIQRCLLYFGVMSTMIKKHGGENFIAGGRDYWCVQISDMYSIDAFRRNIGFSLEVKKVKADAISINKSYGNYLPTLTVDDVKATGANYKKYVFNYLHGRKYSRYKVKDLGLNPEFFHYQWDSFESYRMCEQPSKVYDLIDEPDNRFVANGIVVHNCELRVLGVLSQDPFLIQSYVDGKDLHANVARKIFGDNFTSEQRTQCKTINFGRP